MKTLGWLLFIFSCLFLFAVSSGADPRDEKTKWHFNIKNDWAVPTGHDRFLSNQFEISVGQWTFSNSMYTPIDKDNEEIPYGDRPWDGYSYLQYEIVRKTAFGEEIVLESRLGVVGQAAGSEALQKFIHDDLGKGVHPTWAGQNPSEPTVDLVLSRRTREYIQSIVGDSALRNEFGVRFGTVNDSIFIDQELRKHFFKHLYPYVGVRAEGVLYNTHLDGRLFQHNDYTIDKEWFVATARAGVELYYPESGWFFDYHYEYLTQEFKGQDGRHSYGSLTFGKRW